MTTAVLEQRVPRWRKLVGPDESASRSFVLGGGAAILTLVGSFLNFLSFNHYALLRAEVAMVLAVLVVVGLLMGGIGARSPVIGRVCIPLFLAILTLDFNFDGFLPLVIGGVVGLVTLRFLRQGLILLFAVVIATSAWNLVGRTLSDELTAPWNGAPAPAAGTSAGPVPDIAIVHVILDEHIGLEGLPDSVPGGAELKQKLRQFYTGHGFRVFGGAYSEAMHTVHAIPRALGLAEPLAWVTGKQQGAIVRDNPYFDRLQALGFRIEVAENDWLEYCEHPAVVTCMPRPAGQLIDVGDALPAFDKAQILAFRFVTLSNFMSGALGLYDVAALLGRFSGIEVPLSQISQRSNTSTLNGMATMQDAIRAARVIEPGEALFAHVLVPHYPYVYDRACQVRRFADWLGRLSFVPWEERYTAYFAQVECATAKIGELLDAIAQSPAAGKTVVIVHGDHGSRITHRDPTAENGDSATERDLIDGYAAFYAVSAPTIQPGYDSARYPLRYLLDALVESGFRSATPTLPSGFAHTIAIENMNRDPAYERSMHDIPWWNAPAPAAD